ncbi:NaeI family type II restriction endonuclease [Rhodoferax sp. TBRC 17660]|uniref:NaeI family type II restriction endonuclease n=1 Tax=Rhodoferax potami TaxID=3068338 RepID=A0ABU3KKV3_9BURK|nr:NaeI family type II restriction endonuclease [Rhodoferax sp. TBRC 17660]MDT7518166.1 NaeI family type II restriction endonuclease [Rhodoferax sp. TBRC 17660]
MAYSILSDKELSAVIAQLKELDPKGERVAKVIRETFNQLYDGQRTGRYRLDQLHKTEKTHCGTLIEINLHREFQFKDGADLDYEIAGIDVDCKYSQDLGGWMIPPEAAGKLCLLVWADDAKALWNMGLIRAEPRFLNAGANRDKKATLNKEGKSAITWLFSDPGLLQTGPLTKLQHLPLAPNLLLQMPLDEVKSIFAQPNGTKRVNQLFRLAQGKIVDRNTVATVAQQDDFLKRVRGNGGARQHLRSEGIIILGHLAPHRQIAHGLGLPLVQIGHFVSVRVSKAKSGEVGSVLIDGAYWRRAVAEDAVQTAPELL